MSLRLNGLFTACVLFKIGDEIKGCLDFLKFVYNKFGFSFKLYLSTRPEKYMGKLELWDSAEKVRLLIL